MPSGVQRDIVEYGRRDRRVNTVQRKRKTDQSKSMFCVVQGSWINDSFKSW